MKSNAHFKALQEIVSVGLICVEQGLDKKDDVKASILGHIAEHYIDPDAITTPSELPVSVLDMLARVLDLGFEINDGQLKRVCYTPATTHIAAVTAVNTSTLCAASVRTSCKTQGGI